MELRTTFDIDQSPFRIAFTDRIMLIGSCFASSIGAQLEMGKMNVMINPAGTVYNPVSVCNTLDTITYEREFAEDDLYCHNGIWLSFFHHTDFSSDDQEKALEKINVRLKLASAFLKDSKFLFITLGTARIYRLKKTGLIVSNCHKLPSDQFSSELLSVNEIVNILSEQLDRLKSLYPQLIVVFTISPVRHMKDGAHGNQVSKSVLFLAVEELLLHSSFPLYFPAYELVMDDLRDYRFYSDDMIHLSASAISYIWEAFTDAFFDSDTFKIWNEAASITRALSHRFNTDNTSGKKIFAERMLKQISGMEKRVPGINLSAESKYFHSLLTG